MPKTLTERVEHLEKNVDSLRELPARVTRLEVRVAVFDQQVVQLRGEMREGFSAVLQVIDASSMATDRLIGEVRVETRHEFVAFRDEMKYEFAAVRSEMAQEFVAVRAEMAQGFAAVRTEMRVLHEDLIERIARIGEGGRRKRQRKS